MKEIKDIISAYDRCVQQEKRSALATVVHVQGSSYRRPGARMLITENGEMTGAISGGCLEGDALRKAQLVMLKQQAMLVTYDTSDEEDAKIGLGLGCNGIIQVLIEPVLSESKNNPVALLKQVLATRQAYCLVTIFSLEDRHQPQPGTLLLYTRRATVSGHFPFLHDELPLVANNVLTEGRSNFLNYQVEGRSLTVFAEWIPRPVSLVIFGAGNDLIPLVQMAGVLGWETTVIDGRPSYAKQERFAGCNVIVAKPEKALEHIQIDEHVFFLLMTHNYNYDKAILRSLVSMNVRYTGLLGPRKKLDRMLAEFKEEGLHYTSGQLTMLHNPIGLDIGAETPEAIALSILAEIQADVSDRPAARLSAGTEPIHPRAVHE